jgi:hypothetical protein
LTLSSHLSLACLSVIGDRPVEPLSTQSRPRISFSFPSRFPFPLSLPLIGRLFHTRSIYLIYDNDFRLLPALAPIALRRKLEKLVFVI